MHNLFLVYLTISTCFRRPCAHYRKKQLCLCDTWYLLSTQNNKYQGSHEHSCFSSWWALSHQKHVEIDKYTKNKLCTKLVFIYKMYYRNFQCVFNKWVVSTDASSCVTFYIYTTRWLKSYNNSLRRKSVFLKTFSLHPRRACCTLILQQSRIVLLTSFLWTQHTDIILVYILNILSQYRLKFVASDLSSRK